MFGEGLAGISDEGLAGMSGKGLAGMSGEGLSGMSGTPRYSKVVSPKSGRYLFYN